MESGTTLNFLCYLVGFDDGLIGFAAGRREVQNDSSVRVHSSLICYKYGYDRFLHESLLSISKV
jgi:hypothetical protein